jgi:hypothetical protein
MSRCSIEQLSSKESSEALADEILAKIANTRGISKEDLVATLVNNASLENRRDCIQPYELALGDKLSPDRQKHVASCSFCQALLDGARPRERDARGYAREAVSHAYSRIFLLRSFIGVLGGRRLRSLFHSLLPTWLLKPVHRFF